MSQPLFDLIVETRADQIEAAWRKWHELNPQFWVLFQKFTFDLIRAGHAHGSADMVCHRIRWETALRTTGPIVKVNNNHVAYFSRLFAHTYPQHGDFFEKRKRISENKPPYDVDVQVNDGGPAGNEAALDHRLTEVAFLNTREFHRP